MAKLGGRPGHSAHFAATVKLQDCDDYLLAACHMEECDLDLDQKDEADPHDYKPIFALHSKECQRLDSWCYFCQAFDQDDRPMEGTNDMVEECAVHNGPHIESKICKKMGFAYSLKSW